MTKLTVRAQTAQKNNAVARFTSVAALAAYDPATSLAAAASLTASSLAAAAHVPSASFAASASVSATSSAAALAPAPESDGEHRPTWWGRTWHSHRRRHQV